VYYKLSERLIPIEKKLEELSSQNPFQTQQSLSNYKITIQSIVMALKKSEDRISELEQQLASMSKYVEQFAEDDGRQEKKDVKKEAKKSEEKNESAVEEIDPVKKSEKKA
jgi:hypothetical protein